MRMTLQTGGLSQNLYKEYYLAQELTHPYPRDLWDLQKAHHILYAPCDQQNLETSGLFYNSDELYQNVNLL